MTYRLAPAAELDLEEIGDYIAQDNPSAALKLIEELSSKFELLSSQPHLGSAKLARFPNLRQFVHRSYLIIYQADPTPILIVRVLHGARDLIAIFDDE